MKEKIELFLWSRVHALPRWFVERWQAKRLSHAVREAYERIPFYRRLYDIHAVKPEDVRSLADIRLLPTTSKQLFRKYPIEDAMHPSFPPHRYEWKESSGSTGEPFRFPVVRHDPDNLGSIFYEFRFLLWRGFSLRHIAENMKVVRITDAPYARHGSVVPRTLLRENPRLLFNRLREIAPDMVESRPTVLFELAKLAPAFSGSGRLRFPFLVSYGENLTPEMRTFIEAAFGGEMYSRYGLEETGDLAVECSAHDGLHLNEEACIVEIVDDRGNPLPPGKEGRIVATRFRHDTVMPFIRYQTGDMGTIIPETCPCGLRARRIRVQGRSDLFIEVGEKKFHFSEFGRIFERLGVRMMRYQIAKTGPEALEIRIIPVSPWQMKETERLKFCFRENFGFDPKITFTDSFRSAKSGKTPYFVDETALGTSHA